MLHPTRCEVQRHPGAPMSLSKNWLPALIVALAFLVRVWALDAKPPHFDEGVNGGFVDELRHHPSYHYDPQNFHGPLHFYALFTSTQLLGRGVWALRFPTVLIGAASVAMMFAFRRFFPARVVLVAALACAISPGMIFYSRDAIHEAWLPFFAMLACYGAFGISGGERRLGDLWAVGIGVAGMVLTKETYILHFAAAWLAWLAGRSMSPERARPAVAFGIHEPATTGATKSFARADVVFATGICVSVVVALYSGLFFYWRGVAGIFETFYWMAIKGWTGSEAGHHKEFLYYVKLLGTYEWPAMLGLALAPVYALRRTRAVGGIAVVFVFLIAVAGWFWTAGQPVAEQPFHAVAPVLQTAGVTWSTVVSIGVRAVLVGICWMFAAPLKCPRLRFLALYGLASLAAYSFVSYKTPWCVINLLWPFYFLLGHLFDRMTFHSDGRAVLALGGILAVAPIADAYRINFSDPVNPDEPYIYVQQLRELDDLTKPIEKLLADDPAWRNLTGIIICNSPQPLPWALPELPGVVLQNHEGEITITDADFLLIHESRVEEVESQLLDVYFRSRFRFYNPTDEHRLYLRASTFRDFVKPGRVPEFHRRVRLDATNEGDER